MPILDQAAPGPPPPPAQAPIAMVSGGPPAKTPPVRDPILRKAMATVQAKLPPALQAGVQGVILAGLAILYSPQSQMKQKVQQMYDQVQQGGFKPQDIATGMVQLLAMIVKGSGGKAPGQALYPAGVELLCYVLDDLEKTRGLKVTDALLKSVGQMMAKVILQGMKKKPGAPPQPAPPAAPQAAPSASPTPQPGNPGV